VTRSPAFAALAALVLAGPGALGACSSAVDRPDAPSSAWSLGPAVPRRVLDAGVAALGLRVVVAGGYTVGPADGLDVSARVDVFDTTISRWAALPDAPVRWTSPNLAAVGGTLYLLGGLDGGVARGEAYALGPLDDDWRPIDAMDPGDARGASGVVTAPGRIYLLGGASSTGALASCLELDITTGAWSHLPDLPAPRAYPAAMRRADGTLIVAGGLESLDASAPRAEVWALPPPGAAERTWQLRGAMQPAPRVPRGQCAYGVVLGHLVCAGGEGSPDAATLVESYEPYTDEWTVGEPMPVARAGTQGAAIGGRLYVPGGAELVSRAPADTLYIYAPLDTAMRSSP
jgi:hypothetical protein